MPTRSYIAYDIRGVDNSNDAAVLEAMGEYDDRNKVLQELQHEGFIDMYGPYVVYSYQLVGKNLIDEQLEFVDFGDGQGICDVSSDTFHCSSLSRGPRRRGRRRNKRARRND